MTHAQMKLENQVCSRELAKKLKGLGVNQESFFRYERDVCSGEVIWLVMIGVNLFPEREHYAAFTVAELGEILPKWIHSYQEPDGNTPWICTMPNWYESESFREIFPDPKIFKITHTRESTESNARAAMLIYLLENKLITL